MKVSLVMSCLMISHLGHASPVKNNMSIAFTELDKPISTQAHSTYTQIAQASYTTCLERVQKSTALCNKNAKTEKARSSCTTRAQAGVSSCTQRNNQANQKSANKKARQTTLEMKKKALEIGNE